MTRSSSWFYWQKIVIAIINFWHIDSILSRWTWKKNRTKTDGDSESKNCQPRVRLFERSRHTRSLWKWTQSWVYPRKLLLIKHWCYSWLCWNAGRVSQITFIIKLWLCSQLCDYSRKNDGYPLLQKSVLDLWSNSPNENLVYGLKENSMRLFQDTGEAIHASYIGPGESKFCYMEVKLEPTGEEQFEFQTLKT